MISKNNPPNCSVIIIVKKYKIYVPEKNGASALGRAHMVQQKLKKEGTKNKTEKMFMKHMIMAHLYPS